MSVVRLLLFDFLIVSPDFAHAAMWHFLLPHPSRTPCSRLIEGILIHVVLFLAHVYSMQVVWKGHYRRYRIN